MQSEFQAERTQKYLHRIQKYLNLERKRKKRLRQERVTRSRGAALVELKSPPKRLTRLRSAIQTEEMPEAQEDSVESVATPSTRSSKRKSVTGSITDAPKSVGRSSRRTRSLAAATSVEDGIAEDSEAESVIVEDKNSNESEVEENLESRNRKTKVKIPDSTDDKPVTRTTRRTRSVVSAAVEEPELESVDEESLAEKATTGRKLSKVNEVEPEAVEEEPEVEVKRITRSKKSEGTEEMEAVTRIEDGEAEGQTQESSSSVAVATEESSVEPCVEAEKKIKSPKSKKSPKVPEEVVEIEETCVGAGNEENKKESKKSLDGTETGQETRTDINMNNGEIVKSVAEPEDQEGSNQALPKVREVGEEEIVDFISSCRQETEKTNPTEEATSEKAKTPKKTPKKQKGKVSAEELVDNQELESKKSEETMPGEAILTKTPPKQGDPSSEASDAKMLDEVSELAQNGETANDGSEDVVLRLEDDCEEVKISESPKKKKVKTPKKTKDIEELSSSENNFKVSVFDTPASSPEEAVLPKTSPETTEKVPELETPKSAKVIESTAEGVKVTKTPKSAKKSKAPKEPDNLSTNDVVPVVSESEKSDEIMPEEVTVTKTPKKSPKKQDKPSTNDEECVDNQEPESKKSDEIMPEEAEPPKTPKKTPKKRKGKSSVEELVDQSEPEPESKESDETMPEETEPPKTPKKTPKKQKSKPSVEDETADAEVSTPVELVNDAVSEVPDQVKDSPVFTKVKSPKKALTEDSIAKVVHNIMSPLLKKADIQNDADSDVTFEPISKTLLEEKTKSKKTADVLPRQSKEKDPNTDVIVIADDNPIVIDDSEEEELQNLELIKLIKKLKKKKKILKALEIEENGKKPKKKSKKKKIVETVDLNEIKNETVENETVENEESVKEVVETSELTEEKDLTTENAKKKKKKKNKKKKIPETEVPNAENRDATAENEEVPQTPELTGTFSKKRKLAEELSKETLKKSKDTNAVDETKAPTEKSKKREHGNTDDGSSNEKKLKLATDKEMTPGVIYTSSLPNAVDSIEIQNLFLEEKIKLLYMRKVNWKTEICIENSDQIGAATSLLSQHYMGNSVRIDKYVIQPKTESLTDNDGLRFCQVYVNRIAPHVTESDIRSLFPKSIRCDLPKKNSGVNKGFCYLTFPDKTTSREHLALSGKVNLAGYKLGIFARNKDSSKGVYGNLLKEMLVHITDLDSVLIIENLPSNLQQYNLSSLFPSVLHIHATSRSIYTKEAGAVVICKTAEQAEEFLCKEILWEGEPLTVKKATRDLLHFARKTVNESPKKPAAYSLSTLLVSNLPEKTVPKEIEELFPSCVLMNVVAKKKYALVGFCTRAEMLAISRTKSGELKIRDTPVSVKPYSNEPPPTPTKMIESEADFNKLLHVRGFPRGTQRPELKAVFKNCKISMTQTDGVPYAVVKCKNGKKAKDYFSRKNLVVGGQILKIRYLQSILKQMKKEAEL